MSSAPGPDLPAPGPLAPIEAVVFDMDGVLVDSEPLWHEAEIEVFGRIGLQLTMVDCQQTTGVRIDNVVRHWRAQHPALFVDVDDTAVVADIVAGVVARVSARGEPMPGAYEAVAHAASRGLHIGLASSSPRAIIDAVLERLQVRDSEGRASGPLKRYFAVVCSAEHMPRGKPDPAVYLEACQKLGVDPRRAVAVEDSNSGIQAGKNAGMFVVAVPDPSAARPASLSLADVVIESLRELPGVLDRLIDDRAPR